MSKFSFTETSIKGLYVIEPSIFIDNRGYFVKFYEYNDFKAAGMDNKIIEENQSKSVKGVLRGLHFQKKNPQGKLIRVVKGEIFDVAVDLRISSETYGKWYGIILSDENKKQFYIPEGFAHGFLVLSDEAEVLYKCTNFYHPEDEGGLLWNDKTLAIKWPLQNIDKVILSDKDTKWSSFRDFTDNLNK